MLRRRTAEDLLRRVWYRRFTNRRFEDKCVTNLEIRNEGKTLSITHIFAIRVSESEPAL